MTRSCAGAMGTRLCGGVRHHGWRLRHIDAQRQPASIAVARDRTIDVCCWMTSWHCLPRQRGKAIPPPCGQSAKANSQGVCLCGSRLLGKLTNTVGVGVHGSGGDERVVAFRGPGNERNGYRWRVAAAVEGFRTQSSATRRVM